MAAKIKLKRLKAEPHSNLEEAIKWCQRGKVTLVFTGKHVVANFTSRPAARVTSDNVISAIHGLRNLPLTAFNSKK